MPPVGPAGAPATAAELAGTSAAAVGLAGAARSAAARVGLAEAAAAGLAEAAARVGLAEVAAAGLAGAALSGAGGFGAAGESSGVVWAITSAVMVCSLGALSLRTARPGKQQAPGCGSPGLEVGLSFRGDLRLPDFRNRSKKIAPAGSRSRVCPAPGPPRKETARTLGNRPGGAGIPPYREGFCLV
ncbi:hypothetical protein L3i22_007390 [Actinoplanes sp. L3-i22]|nr:hypothetical protein L3i22_007390 [Actinoplanes sp. L3-i22]